MNGGREMILETIDSGIGVLMSALSALWRLSELIMAAGCQWGPWIGEVNRMNVRRNPVAPYF